MHESRHAICALLLGVPAFAVQIDLEGHGALGQLHTDRDDLGEAFIDRGGIDAPEGRKLAIRFIAMVLVGWMGQSAWMPDLPDPPGHRSREAAKHWPPPCARDAWDEHVESLRGLMGWLAIRDAEYEESLTLAWAFMANTAAQQAVAAVSDALLGKQTLARHEVVAIAAPYLAAETLREAEQATEEATT